MRIISILILILAILFLPGQALSKGISSLDLNSVSIPAESGTIKEVYRSPARAERGSKTIFHIQDAHGNYEAQKNLAAILEHLIKTYGLQVILVEGGITDKDWSYLRSWASPEERRRKAGALLKEGIISGEAYVDISTDFQLKFQGIEDKELYEKNMEAYMAVDEFKKEAIEVLEALDEVLVELKKRIYTSRLRKFDESREAYSAGKMELIEYIGYLDEVAAREKLDLSSYGNFSIFFDTVRMEKEIDFKKVEGERDSLIKSLTEAMDEGNMKELLMMSLKFKEGQIIAGDFYSRLRDMALAHGVGLNKYANLNKYIDYIINYERLDKIKLLDNLSEIEERFVEALCKSEDQKRLFVIAKDVALLEKFFMLRLSPEEFKYYKENKGSFVTADWRDFLEGRAKRFRIKPQIPYDLTPVDKNLTALESFYNAAFDRDKAFLRNSLTKMEKEKADISVLIAGGFHTENLKRLFMDEGISYIVILPMLTEATDFERFERIRLESYRTRAWD
ncbi:MAG: hypothetical protein ABH875_06080 [Candidatus Omnitrophota bacterium]